MSSLKYRPMAVIGFTALIIIFAAAASGFVFSGGLVSLAVGAVLAAALIITKEFKRFTVLAYICAAMVFSGVLLMSSSAFGSEEALKYADKYCDVTACVTDKSSVYDNSVSYTVKAEEINGESTGVKITVYSKGDFGFEPGDKIRFSSKLRNNISSDGFSVRLSKIAEEEYLYTSLYGSSSVSVCEKGSNKLQRCLYLIRSEIKSRIYSFLPGEEGAVTVAMLIGDKSGVSDEIISNFSVSGISHLFAVSGLHLSVWVMSFYAFLKKFLKKRRIPEILCLVFIVFFAALTGFTASVCRAGLMLALVLLSKIFNEESDPLNSLGFAVFIILMINPMSAVSVSLILSFSATLGIITAYPYVQRKIAEKLKIIENQKIRNFYKYVFSLGLVSLCASVFTLPASSFFIGTVSLVAPITNMLVSLAATAQMISGGLSALLSPLIFAARPCALICGLLGKYVLFVSDFLSDIPFACLDCSSVFFKSAVILAVSGTICTALLAENPKKRICGSALSVSGAGLASFIAYIIMK